MPAPKSPTSSRSSPISHSPPTSYNSDKLGKSGNSGDFGTPDNFDDAGSPENSDKPCICIRLRRIAHKVTALYDKALAPLGITINQYSLLVNIGRQEGCGTGELAQHVGLEKSTLVRSLAPLFKAGLIEDRATPCGQGNSRRRCLHLCERGQAVLQQARPLWRQVQDGMAAKLGKNHEVLMELFAAVDAWE